MPRITPLDPTRITGPAADELAATRAMLGSTPNMFTTAAQAPAALAALNGFFAALAKGSIGGPVGERVAIAIAQENGCGYCLSAHTALGRMHKVDPAELAAARRGASNDARAQAAITFALAIVRTKGRVDDATLAAARLAGLSDQELVELVAHAALNIFTNSLNNLAGTDIDFPVVPIVPIEQAA